jgi:hypothetical protein
MLNEFVLNGDKFTIIGKTYRKNGSFIKKEEWLKSFKEFENLSKSKKSYFVIQSLGGYEVKSSETLITKNLGSGKWEVKLSKPFNKQRRFYFFDNLKKVRSFLTRHNLIKEHESFTKQR